MPGNTKKKRRKKRGTQGGRVSTRPAGRPRNRQEARQRAQQRRTASSSGSGGGRKAPEPASWRGAFTKGALASLLFFALFAGLFKRGIGPSLGLALFTLVFYVPLSYYLDQWMYGRYQRNLQ